jgi:hypothetical protein
MYGPNREKELLLLSLHKQAASLNKRKKKKQCTANIVAYNSLLCSSAA